MDNAVALSAIGVLGTSVGLMAWVVKTVLGKVSPALEKHGKSADKLKDTVENLDVSIKSFDTYLRERNGRDNEMHKENIEIMRDLVAGFKNMSLASQENQEKIYKEINEIKVKHQSVDQQTVKKQIIES